MEFLVNLIFKSKQIHSYIYFLVALGVHCARGLSLVVLSRGYSLLWRMGFSLPWLLLLHQFSSVQSLSRVPLFATP